MTGPYSAGGLWLYDGNGRRIALCYTVPTAAELAEELNKPTMTAAPPAGRLCLLCNAREPGEHDPTCPRHPDKIKG